MPKTCKKCNITKDDSEYLSKYATCKECYNAKRREERKVKITKINQELYPIIQKTKNVLDDYLNGKNSAIDVGNIADQLGRESKAVQAKTLYLSFPYELSPDVYSFLHTCIVKHGIKLRNVRGLVNNDAFEKDFLTVYGVEQQVMRNYSDEIREVSDTLSGIFMYYNTFIDEFNCIIIKPPNWTKIPLLTEDQVFYNFTTSTIDILINPLKLDDHRFFTKIKMDTADISTRAFHELGIFNKYYTIYDVK
jgi:hypothetical protein